MIENKELLNQRKIQEFSLEKYESRKPNLIHNTVNYFIIDVPVCPEGKNVVQVFSSVKKLCDVMQYRTLRQIHAGVCIPYNKIEKYVTL